MTCLTERRRKSTSTACCRRHVLLTASFGAYLPRRSLYRKGRTQVNILPTLSSNLHLNGRPLTWLATGVDVIAGPSDTAFVPGHVQQAVVGADHTDVAPVTATDTIYRLWAVGGTQRPGTGRATRLPGLPAGTGRRPKSFDSWPLNALLGFRACYSTLGLLPWRIAPQPQGRTTPRPVDCVRPAQGPANPSPCEIAGLTGSAQSRPGRDDTQRDQLPLPKSIAVS